MVFMSLNKTIWREAIAQYKAWNRAKFAEQVKTFGQKSTIEKWQEYEELMSLCWSVKPQEWEEKWSPKEWSAYYTSMAQFEERRGKREYGNETTFNTQ